MPANQTHITSILQTFSTFLATRSIDDRSAESAMLTLVEYLQVHKDFSSWNPEKITEVLNAIPSTNLNARQLVHEFLLAHPPHQTNVYLNDFLLALLHDNCSQSTIRNYRSDIGQFISFAQISTVGDLLQKPNILSFLKNESHKGLKSSSLKRKLISITQFALWAEEHDLISTISPWLAEISDHIDKLLIDQTKSIHTKPKDASFRHWTLPIENHADKLRESIWRNPFAAAKSKDSAQNHQELQAKLKAGLASLTQNLQIKTQAWMLPYLNLSMIVLFFMGAIYFGYLQFFRDAPAPLAYPTSLTRPNRTLSFQGRLTDSAQNPLTTATDFRFRLYDSGPSTTGGTELWDSTTCSVTPDQDGIFAVGLGDDCGSEIGENVFTENSNVWLQVEVETEVLDPRQQIKTVAYALNSETLQGYPASASAVENTVIVMDNNGDIVLGSASPTLRATGDSFAIEADSLALQTAAGSNGDVNIDPDGTGVLNVLSNLYSSGYLAAPGATLSATYAGGKALVVRGGPSGTANIQEWQNNTGTALSVVDNGGNFGIGSTSPQAALDVVGDLYISSGISTFGTAVSNGTIESTQFCTGDGETNCVTDFAALASGAGIWTDGGAVTYLTSTTDDLAIGGTNSSAPFFFDESAELLTLTNTTGGDSFRVNDVASDTTPFVIDATGNVGIGTTTPGYKLDISGNQNITGDLYFTRASQVFNPSIEQISTLGTGNIDVAARGNISMYIDSNNNGSNYFGVFGNGTSSQLFTVHDGGNVGIGTAITSPTAYLDIAGAETGRASLRLRSSATPPTTPNDGDVYYDTAKDSLMLYTGGKWQADRSTATVIVGAPDSRNYEKAEYVTDGAGGTDDTTTIESALAALPASGGVVVLLEGNYYLGSILDITTSNTAVIGTGKGTILQRNFDGSYAVNIQASTTAKSGIQLANLSIVGNSATYTNVSNVNLRLNASLVNLSGVTLRDLYISDSAGDGIQTTSTTASVQLNMYNVTSQQNGSDGFTASGNLTNSSIQGSTFANNTAYGIFIGNSGTARNEFSGNNIYSNSRGISENSGVENRYIGNTIRDNSSYGMWLQGTRPIVDGNTFYNNGNTTIYNSGADNAQITNNYISGGSSSGIYIYASEYNQITNNYIYAPGGSGISVDYSSYATVAGNTIINATLYGVVVDSISMYTAIRNNYISGSTRYGIYLTGTGDVDYTEITDNYLFDNGGSGTDSSIYIGNASSSSNRITNNRIVDTAGTGYAISANASSASNTLSGNSYSGTGATSINIPHATTSYLSQLVGNDYSILPSSGNVGIGTTAPGSYKLNVNGATYVSNTLTVGSLAAGATDTVITHSLNVLQQRTIDSRVWGTSLVDGTGTTNYVTKWADANTIQNSLIYDSGTAVGIGTTTLPATLTVAGGGNFSGSLTVGSLAAGATDSVVTQSSGELQTRSIDNRVWGSTLVDGSGSSNYVPRWSDSNTLTDSLIYDTGSKVGIGTTTPFGYFQSQQTSTTTGGNVSAIMARQLIDATANSSGQYYSVWSAPEIQFGNTYNYTGGVYGFYGSPLKYGTGTLDEMAGFFANPGAVQGTTTAMYGAYLTATLGDGFYSPSVTNYYGVYIADPTINSGGISNRYALVTGANAGNVGIGTTAPASLFSVGSSSQFQVGSDGDLDRIKDLAYSWPTAHTADGVLKNDGSGILTWATLGASAITADSLDFSEFKDAMTLDATTSVAFGAYDYVLNLNSTGDFNIQDAGVTQHIFYDNGDVRLGESNELFVDTSAGNVGIGTPTPSMKLHLYQDVDSTSGILVQNPNAGTGAYAFVRVQNNASATGQFGIGSSATPAPYSGRAFVSSASGISLIAALTSDLRFFTNGTTERMRIDSGGNVGIGSTNPGALLDIGTAGTTLGTLRLAGNTSGYVQIQPSAAAGSWTLTLPTSAGTGGYVLTTNGSGVTSWTDPSVLAVRWNNIADPNGNQTLIMGGYTSAWTYDSLTTGSGLTVSSSSLTSGSLINLTSTSTALTSGGLLNLSATGAPAGSWTGSLATIEYNSANTNVTGNALKVGLLGAAAGSGTALNVTSAQTGTGAYVLRVNDDGTYSDSTPFIIDVAGNVGIGTTAPSSKLALYGGNFLHTASGNPILTSTYDTTGVAYDVYVSGKHAYVADYSSGLQVVDISNPASPTLTGTYNTSGNAYGVYVSGKYAYVADDTAGLQVVDISNPASPSLTGTYNTSGNAYGVYVSGKYAYVADYASGLQVVDISNPASPTLTGTYDTTGLALGVYVSGKYAYVADDTAGLQVVDISNPASPSLTGTYNTSGNAYGVYVSGKYAYVADRGSGLQIINISNPASPSFTGTYDTTGWARGLYVSGKYAYVADEGSGLQVIDISNPASPSLTGTYDTSGFAMGGVYVSGKYAYVADNTAGLQVIDINGVETPSLYAGNINTNALTATENIDVGNNLFVRNGLNVGPGGLYSDGIVGIGVNSAQSALSITQRGAGNLFDLWDNTTNVFTVIDGGNVGIGTTAPNAMLELGGSGIASASAFTARGASPGYINQLNGNDMVFRTSVGGDVGLIERMRIANNTGYIGIGSTAPAHKLDVNGSINATSYYVNGSPMGTVTAGTVTGQTLYWNGTGWTATSNLFNDNTNVGIGTTTLGAKLHVNGVTQDAIQSIAILGANNASAQNKQFLFRMTAGDSDPLALIRTNSSAGNDPKLGLAVGTDTPSLTVALGGNVGIGTTSPTQKLQLQSGTSTTTLRLVGTLSSSDINNRIDFADDRGTGYAGVRLQTFRNTVSGGQGLSFWTTADNAAEVAGTYTERMRISEAGNVGIGTTSPAQKLWVEGSGGTSGVRIAINDTDVGGVQWHLLSGGSGFGVGNFNIRDGTTGNNRLTIDTTGNVGIGTNSPTVAKLQVAGNIYPEGKYIVQNSVDGGSSRGIMMWNAADTNWGIYMGTSGATKSLSGGAATTGANGFAGHAIRLRTANSTTQGIIFENASENLLFSVRADGAYTYLAGNVGIGSINPGYTLDVTGNTRISSTMVVNGGSSTNWASVNIGGNPSINANGAIYSYNSMCTGNNSGACTSTGGTVIGIANTSANNNIPNSGDVIFNNGSNVGIGITNPQASLDINNTGTSGLRVINDDTTHTWFNYNNTNNNYLRGSITYVDTTLDLNNNNLIDINWAGSDDGPGSGLDADVLDSIDSTGFSRAFGYQTFSSSSTTAAFITELSSKGLFSYPHASAKGSWSYAGNSDISDTGFGAFELAGTSIETWTDGSTKTVLAIRPTTGAGGGQILVYNDQGAGYSPGWRQIWTNTTDGSGSTLDADLIDGLNSDAFVAVAGDTMTGNLFINNTSPTIVLSDSDHRNGAIHQNSNTMYFLSGSGVNGSSWTINGSYWPLTINMDSDYSVFGGPAYFMEGSIGIGTTNPSYNFHMTRNVGDWQALFQNTDTGGSSVYLAHGNGYGMYIGNGSDATSGTYALRVDTNGIIGWQVSGTGVLTAGNLYNYNNTGSGNRAVYVTTAGVLGYNSSSIRYKKNIVDIDDAEAELLLQLRPVSYQYKQDPDGQTKNWGFIAEETDLVTPWNTFYDEEGLPTGVGYEFFVPGLVKGFQLNYRNIENLSDISAFQQASISALQKIVPSITINSTDELALTKTIQDYQVTKSGLALDNFFAAAKAAIANIQAGLISTQELVVTKTASISSLSVDSLSVGGQTIRNYIAGVVAEMSLGNQSISLPADSVLSSITTENIIATGSAQLANVSTNSLQAGNSKLGQLLATDATISGELTAGTLTTTDLTSENLNTDNATVAGTLIANTINTASARIQALEAGMAQLEAIKAQTAEFTTATISGTLYASSIDQLEERIEATLRKPTLLESILNSQEQTVPAADVAVVEMLVDYAGYDTQATQSATTQTLADLSGSTPDVELTTARLFVNEYFELNGTGFIAQTLGIGGSLLVGDGMEISSGQIAYSPEGILAPELQIQPSGVGSINFLAGVMTIADNGTVAIKGDLTVEGAIAAAQVKTDTLLTNLIQPIDFGNPFQVQVAGISTSSGEIKKSRFEIINEEGTAVAAFDADGNAEFSGGIKVNDISVTQEDLTTQNLENDTVTTEKTSGKATLTANKDQIIIKANKVQDTSLVYVTPRSSTDNKVLYIKEQKAGEFIVGFDTPLDKDVEFNWWIVN